MLIERNARTYRLACANWQDFCAGINAPGGHSLPEVTVTLWHDGGELHLHFKVSEEAARAECAADRENIWEDSCVELFLAPADDGLYYNFEFSCTGKLYLCCGPDRNHREFLPESAYRLVRRRSSLGDRAFGLKRGGVVWELEADIPAAALAFHDIKDFSGLEARGNLYKCGNKLPARHYLSLAPIDTPAPDFHRPEYFEKMTFSL